MEVSIDEPLNVDWDGNELLLSDILGTDEDIIYRDLEDEVERKLLKKALSKLSKREKMIIELRFGLNHPAGREMTQKEVADLLGISQSYISRLEKKIIGRLKKEIVKYEESFQIAFHGFQGIFLQPAYLCLRDMDLFGHLHLGFSLKKAQIDNVIFPGA